MVAIKDIKADAVTLLAQMHCTCKEAAAYLECSPQLINDRCREWFDMTAVDYFKEQRGAGVVILKKTAWKKALNGEWEPLKFHLKNYAEMSDTSSQQFLDKNGNKADPPGSNPYLAQALEMVEKSKENG